MMRLTEQQKKILEHVVNNPGCSTEEIAKALHTGEDTVKVQMHRVRDSLIGTGMKIARGYVLRGE
jgi:DNA-binding NarL/FixJ family response regulator